MVVEKSVFILFFMFSSKFDLWPHIFELWGYNLNVLAQNEVVKGCFDNILAKKEFLKVICIIF